jgi:hypothetical protein
MSAPPTPPGIAQAFAVARTEILQLQGLMWSVPPQALGPAETSATKIDAEWLNRLQEEGARLVLDKVRLGRPRQESLPDVPLHRRGFGVRGEGAQ